MNQDLIEKALAKATGLSQNDIKNAKSGSITIKQATEAIQWALDERTDEILGTLREKSQQMWDDENDHYRCYGFDDAVNLVNDNFTE